MGSDISSHARKRASQRGITENIFDLIKTYGEEAYPHNGGRVLYLSKYSILEIKSEMGECYIQTLGRKAAAYAVVADKGDWITLGIRYKRIKT